MRSGLWECREGGVADRANGVGLQGAGPAVVGASLLGRGDALGLAPPHELAFVLGDGAHYVQLESGERFDVAGCERQALFEDLNRGPPPGSGIVVTDRVAGDLLDDRIEADDRSAQAAHGGDDHEVTAAHMPDQGGELRAVGGGSSGLFLNEDLVALPRRLEPPGRVLVDAGHAGVGRALPKGERCATSIFKSVANTCSKMLHGPF